MKFCILFVFFVLAWANKDEYLNIPVPTCIGNEQLETCGTACEPSCEVPNPPFCTEQCLVNVCQCKPGFVRKAQNKKCVPLAEC